MFGSGKIFNFISEINESNSSKYKLEVLKKYNCDEVKDLLRYTYDSVSYTYGVSSRTILDFPIEQAEKMWEEKLTFTYPRMFELLERLSKREFTGHKALAVCKYFCLHNEPERVELFLKIIDRDLKINISSRSINKVFKNLISKPHYNRCDVFGEKALKKIHFPAYLQLKCDGTYREAIVENNRVTLRTRSGEPDTNPILEKELQNLPNGVYTGEFTIGKADENFNGRFEGNGLINSDHPPYDKIVFTIWDYLTFGEYNFTDKNAKNYKDRFDRLENIMSDCKFEHIFVVPTTIVNNIEEALAKTSEYMEKGLEGGVLKDFKMMFKDGTSKQQLKIKLKVDADVRIVGYTEGSKGTKREGKIGAIVFETDDHKIKGQCSGFSDEQLDDFTINKDKYLNLIMAVEFNDISKAAGSETYALTHPRFKEVRTDKTETDTFERVVQLRNMARGLK